MGCVTPAAPTSPVVEETVEVEAEETAEAEVEEPAEAAKAEAPMLAEKVAAGELPPLEERLPLDPRVVEGPTDVGIYGGTLKMLDGQARLSIPHRFTDHGLFGYNIPTSAYHADVARDWSWNDDYTELTIYLRRGMKWSDGDDLTTEDFLWYWDNVLHNDVLRPNGPGWPWEIEEAMTTLDIIDDYTLKYTFSTPLPAIMDRWGRSSFSSPGQWFWGPSHWHKQFHADFVDDVDTLNATAEAAGFEGDAETPAWVGYFNSKGGQFYNGIQWGDNLDMPTVRPWNPVEVTQEYILMERNPYFWMVDTAGNQLPYFDYVRFDAVGDMELYNLKLTAGDADVAMWFPSFENMELYKANEADGEYTTLIAQYMNECAGAFAFNMGYQEDAAIGDLMRNIDFRRAISLGLDRENMNDVMYFGLAEPHPTAPWKDMPWWSESFWNEYYEYDPELANQMLDELGLDQFDAEGYRLMEDGERLTLILTGDYAYFNIAAELIIDDMKQLGIEIIYKLLDPSAFSDASLNNELQLTARGISRGTLFGRGTPDNWALRPADVGRHRWGPAFIQWIASDGEEGVEPPDYILDHVSKWDTFVQMPSDSPEAAEFGKEYFQFFADQLFMLCGPGIPPQPFIVGNDIGNFPREDLKFASDNNFYHPYYPELWYRE
jgi:peptide/nickel transport system substrate-binding protein